MFAMSLASEIKHMMMMNDKMLISYIPVVKWRHSDILTEHSKHQTMLIGNEFLATITVCQFTESISTVARQNRQKLVNVVQRRRMTVINVC